VTPIFVGNDVVDLREPAAKEAAHDVRFVERVFTERERAAIAAAADPTATLWSLFAAKEAGYKVVAKILPGIAFAHRRFEVGPGLSEIWYDDVRLNLWIDMAPDRAHAVACTRPSAHVSGLAAVAPGADPSVAARRLLKTAMAARIGCTPDELEIVRDELPGSWDGFGPPRLVFAGRPVAADVSLSHDGGFVAFAAAGAMLSAPEG
jgi:phosphopantetheine--protein transferase-like protein